MQTSGHIFIKSIQIIAYADKEVSMARTRRDLVDEFCFLEDSEKEDWAQNKSE